MAAYVHGGGERGGYSIRVQELDETHAVAEQPAGAAIALKRHQLTLLARARHMEHGRLYHAADGVTALTAPLPGQESTFMQTRVGVLCDQVGSGKSYVVLALALDNAPVRDDPLVMSYSDGLVVSSGPRPQLRRLATNVLVIPHNLCQQWAQYVAAFKPDLPHAVLSRQKQLDRLLEQDAASSSADLPLLADQRLVIITCALYNRLASAVNDRGLALRRVFFDEVDNLSIPSCLTVNAEFYWFVTASYGNLLYPRGYSSYDHARGRYVTSAVGLGNSGFIKNLFTDLRHGMRLDGMAKLFVRNSPAYVAASVRLPDVDSRTVLCRAPAAVGILTGIADDQIINCLHANDVAGAIQHVNPGHRGTEDSIVALVMDKIHRALRNVGVQVSYTEQMEFERPEDKEAELARLAAKRSELEAKVASVQARIAGASTCPICYDDIDKKTVVNCCSNAFCFKCLSTWLVRNTACPTCRAPMSLQQNLFVVDGSSGDGDAAASSSKPAAAAPDRSAEVHESNTKIKNLENIIRAGGPDSRFLVFSSFETPFHRISEVLDAMGVPYAYLKGNNHVINRIVEGYRSGRVRVLLINTTYYGSGLNLENTTDVVMFHKFDSEIEKQVVGRAQRCGRQASLRAWYLLHANEAPAA